MSLACDFLSVPSTPQAIHDAGYGAVLWYLRNPHAPASQWLDAGLGIGTIFETAANEATFANGTTDGQTAASQAQGIRQPAGTIIWVNVGDFAATPSQIPAIIQYYNGFYGTITSAGFACGGYATGYIIQQLVAAGCGGLWWQNAMDDNGVSGSQVVPEAALYQRVTPTQSIAGASRGSWDENVVLGAIPWWTSTPPVPTPTPVPPPPLPPKEEMASPLHVVDNAANEAVEFCYIGVNGHIIQCIFIAGQGWSKTDLTEAAGFPVASTT